MHALSLNSKFLVTTRNKYFPCFIATQIVQSSPPVVRNASSKDRWKHRKCLKLLCKLRCKQNRRKIFVMEEKFKHIISLCIGTNFWSSISLLISMYMLNERYSCYWHLSQRKPKLFITFVIPSVLAEFLRRDVKICPPRQIVSSYWTRPPPHFCFHLFI